MKTLCVDTTMDNLIVTVTNGDKDSFVVNDKGRATTSKNIIGCIDEALSLEKLSLSDIDYIGAIVGPGSFTGIRIGISVINAFSMALGKPIIAISAFEVLSSIEKSGIAVVDARHSFYGAKFDSAKIKEQREFAQEEIFNSEEKVFMRSNTQLTYAIAISDIAYAKKMMAIIKNKASRGETVAYLSPLYMKKSQAERNLQ